MRAPITDKHLLEMMWERFPEIMGRGVEQPAQYLSGLAVYLDPSDGLKPKRYAPQPAQRKPLTDEEMYLAIRPLFKTDALANAALKISKDEYQAIEAAHGIKENT